MANLQGRCQQRPSNGLTTSIVSSCETRLAIDRFLGFPLRLTPGYNFGALSARDFRARNV
jgi:hypothetical protein